MREPSKLAITFQPILDALMKTRDESGPDADIGHSTIHKLATDVLNDHMPKISFELRQAERTELALQRAVMAMRAVVLRISCIGAPGEPMMPDGTPDWRPEIDRLGVALHGKIEPDVQIETLPDLVRIFSGQHGAYWRPDGGGYTNDLSEAWVTSREEAVKRTRHCGREKRIELWSVAGTEAERVKSDQENTRQQEEICRKMLEDNTRLKAELYELREAISPGRMANLEYYLKVAAQMRSKETVIKPKPSQAASPGDSGYKAKEHAPSHETITVTADLRMHLGELSSIALRGDNAMAMKALKSIPGSRLRPYSSMLENASGQKSANIYVYQEVSLPKESLLVSAEDALREIATTKINWDLGERSETIFGFTKRLQRIAREALGIEDLSEGPKT